MSLHAVQRFLIKVAFSQKKTFTYSFQCIIFFPLDFFPFGQRIVFVSQYLATDKSAWSHPENEHAAFSTRPADVWFGRHVRNSSSTIFLGWAHMTECQRAVFKSVHWCCQIQWISQYCNVRSILVEKIRLSGTSVGPFSTTLVLAPVRSFSTAEIGCCSSA